MWPTTSRLASTDVIRAEEWLISTPKHVILYHALGEPLPRFLHVSLLRNADKSKISKRKNPVSLDWFRQQGYLPEALLNFLALADGHLKTKMKSLTCSPLRTTFASNPSPRALPFLT